ncbi:hypothetical protein EB796_022357 [Bugula neritina]|uniref:Deoxynucleoside kinase domain-containing protein n=1 Tax=Bugula neritina TaxID=10212 RepID=A0A7J7IZJ6_BUGNE|nr:hypothetical protein EB796_022357 [Bugula neritina]
MPWLSPLRDVDNNSQVSTDSGMKSSAVSPSDSSSLNLPHRPFVVSVEGNIGSGKTTLMQYFERYDCVEAVPEPIDKWTNLKGHNALGNLYMDANRWSFSFNTYASLTRCQMHETKTNKSVVLLERSLYSTRYCFVENSYQSGDLHEMEYEILTRWFNYLVKHEHLPIDLIVYLKAEPVKCYERLRQRHRREEVSVPISLIEDLHRFHECWLIEKKYPVPAPVLILDANLDRASMQSLFDEHKSKILCGQI